MSELYGLKPQTIQAINSVFSKFPDIEAAVIYGSRAKGNYHNGSDIDLTIKGELLDLSLLFKIETELDDLLLPYSIDLSIFHKIDNQKLVEHIEKIGLIFYKKTI